MSRLCNDCGHVSCRGNCLGCPECRASWEAEVQQTKPDPAAELVATINGLYLGYGRGEMTKDEFDAAVIVECVNHLRAHGVQVEEIETVQSHCQVPSGK